MYRGESRSPFPTTRCVRGRSSASGPSFSIRPKAMWERETCLSKLYLIAGAVDDKAEAAV